MADCLIMYQLTMDHRVSE